MKVRILFVLLFATAVCHAQTKAISHKSHSGSRQSFAKAYQKNLFDLPRSNFGLPPMDKIIVLDTVIAISNTMTLLKYRETIKVYRLYSEGFYKTLKPSDFTFKTDTIRNHKIWNRQNTTASIKVSGTQGYPLPFENPIDSVVFIGFK